MERLQLTAACAANNTKQSVPRIHHSAVAKPITTTSPASSSSPPTTHNPTSYSPATYYSPSTTTTVTETTKPEATAAETSALLEEEMVGMGFPRAKVVEALARGNTTPAQVLRYLVPPPEEIVVPTGQAQQEAVLTRGTIAALTKQQVFSTVGLHTVKRYLHFLHSLSSSSSSPSSNHNNNKQQQQSQSNQMNTSAHIFTDMYTVKGEAALREELWTHVCRLNNTDSSGTSRGTKSNERKSESYSSSSGGGGVSLSSFVSSLGMIGDMFSSSNATTAATTTTTVSNAASGYSNSSSSSSIISSGRKSIDSSSSNGGSGASDGAMRVRSSSSSSTGYSATVMSDEDRKLLQAIKLVSMGNVGHVPLNEVRRYLRFLTVPHNFEDPPELLRDKLVKAVDKLNRTHLVTPSAVAAALS
jgi:hypothetical protein